MLQCSSADKTSKRPANQPSYEELAYFVNIDIITVLKISGEPQSLELFWKK